MQVGMWRGAERRVGAVESANLPVFRAAFRANPQRAGQRLRLSSVSRRDSLPPRTRRDGRSCVRLRQGKHLVFCGNEQTPLWVVKLEKILAQCTCVLSERRFAASHYLTVCSEALYHTADWWLHPRGYSQIACESTPEGRPANRLQGGVSSARKIEMPLGAGGLGSKARHLFLGFLAPVSGVPKSRSVSRNEGAPETMESVVHNLLRQNGSSPALFQTNRQPRITFELSLERNVLLLEPHEFLRRRDIRGRE